MAGQLTIDTLKASSGVLATQNGMSGIAKAWVNFSGTTVATAGSFNVSSITRNGAGNYTVSFTTAMTSTNYAVGGTSSGMSAASGSIRNSSVTTDVTTAPAYSYRTTGNVLINTYSGGQYDPYFVSVIIYA